MLKKLLFLLSLIALPGVVVKAENLLDLQWSAFQNAFIPQSVFVVNTAGDQSDALPGDGFCDDGGGSCSLRAAIQETNAFPGANVIDFDLPGGCPQTIAPLSPLPAITDSVTINGYSQFGSLPNAASIGSDAVICIQLSGSLAGSGADGLRINAGNSTVRGLAVYSFTDAGFEVTGNGNIIEGNYVGSNAANSAPLANRLGIFVMGNSNRIGGSTLTARNVIVGNTRAGIALLEPAAANLVQNNYVGLNRNSTAMGNGESGINIFRASNNTIGGATASLRNVISGNGVLAVGGLDASGVYVYGDSLLGTAPNNLIQGNYIGTNPQGNGAIANQTNGVRIEGAANTSIVGNLLSGNLSAGVRISGSSATATSVRGNTIGLDVSRVNDLGNSTDGITVETSGGHNFGGTGNGEGNWIGGNNRYGIFISGSGSENNTVRGNFVGYNLFGAPMPQAGGVIISAPNNSIGGTTPGARNSVAGNATWNIVAIGANATSVQGNYIGLSHTGVATSLPTTYGLLVQDSINCVIGGTAAGAENVVSGNQTGILVTSGGLPTSNNRFEGNLIGTNPAGTTAIPNVNGISFIVADGNTVGGTVPESGNLISGNNGYGVNIQAGAGNIVQGNLIGTALSGTTAIPNQTGINIAGVGSTGNVIGGTDAGAGNVVSGNLQTGIQVSSRAATNRFEGNIVGLKADGAAVLPNSNGMSFFDAAASNIIGGTAAGAGNVISGNLNSGVILNDGSTLNRIEGNKIGTDPTGTVDLGNGLNGVRVLYGNINGNNTTGNVIGGTTPAARNLISGNNNGGVLIQGPTTTGNTIAGNYIGSTASGSDYLPNAVYGVRIDAPNNTVGGPTSAYRNVISGHVPSSDIGLNITNNGFGTLVRNNFIGTTAAGDNYLFNGSNIVVSGSETTIDSNLISGALYGINIGNTSNIVITNNIMGTDAAQTIYLGNGFGVHIQNSSNVRVGEDINGNPAPNVIAGGTRTGIAVVGNGTGNVFRRNAIFNNADLGIDLGMNGVSQNDQNDADLANNLQNFPVIDSIATNIDGSLNSVPNGTFRIEFFSSLSADPTGYGEGRTFLTETIVNTDANGNAFFSIPNPMPVGSFISATATNLSTNDTSEFSAYRQVLTPTAVRFDGATVSKYDNGALIEWRTGLETDNLGFNVYRITDGGRERVNPSLVAGSALLTRANLKSEFQYRWFDPKGNETTVYVIESIDLNGVSELFGSFGVSSSNRSRWKETDSQLLSTGNRETTSKTGLDVAETSEVKQRTTEDAKSATLSAVTDGVRLDVTKNGVYRVASPELFANGLSADCDPEKLELSTEGQSVPMNVVRSQSGGFEAIEFYGRQIDSTETSRRSYFLSQADSPAPRFVKSDFTGEPSTADSYRATAVRRDRTTYFSGLLNGDEENFFGAVVSGDGVSQTLEVSAPATDADAILTVKLQGLTRSPHRVQVEINGRNAGEVVFEAMLKGELSVPLSSGILNAGTNTVRLVPTGGGNDISLVDSIAIEYRRRFVAVDDKLTFTAEGGQEIAISGFTVGSVRVLDVTDEDSVTELAVRPIDPGASGRTERRFGVTPAGSGLRKLNAFGKPESVAGIERQFRSDLRATASSDLLIVTKREFFGAAEPLAALRRNEGLKVAVIDIQDIFDEFSYGHKSTAAVREFLRFSQTGLRIKPRYVLFAGDATFDPKGYLGGNGDLVPTKFVETLTMETASDEWFGTFDQSGRAAFAVGRLPARTFGELSAMVTKIVNYERQTPSDAVTFVSDVTDGFDFGGANDAVRATLPEGVRSNDIRRTETNSSAVRGQILEAFRNHQKLITYVGHGSTGIWRGNVFTNNDAVALNNRGALPVVIAMTCLNGFFQDNDAAGLAENLVKNPVGGAVAVWTSSGAGLPDSYGPLNIVLHRELLGGATLGEAHMRSKAAVANQDLLKTWLLLGDPSMRLR